MRRARGRSQQGSGRQGDGQQGDGQQGDGRRGNGRASAQQGNGRASGQQESRQRGSALMLVPAGFLVLVLLAALAVDSAAAYLAQRQLDDALTAAANDAAGGALANRSFYRSGQVTIDAPQAAAVVCQAIAAQGDRALQDIRVAMAVDGPVIALEGRATITAVFGGLVPGFGTRSVRAEAAAVAATVPAGVPAIPRDFAPLSCPAT